MYLGVGPEQNFTYMAAVRPHLAIIFDIRRGNFDLQLMYKALFELARDRADFVSKLFAKPRPAGLGAQASAADIFGAFGRVPSSETLYKETLQAIRGASDEDARAPAAGRRSRGHQCGLRALLLERLRGPAVAHLRRPDDRNGPQRRGPRLSRQRRGASSC